MLARSFQWIGRTCAGLALLAGCSTTAHAVPSGQELYDEIVARIGIYEDPELRAYIEDLGRQIVSVSEMAGEEFTFTLLDAPDINAFATDDNFVYINRGLLNYVNNEAQLVSVLAHEVAHVTKEHVEETQGAQFGTQMLAMIAAVLSGSNEVYEAGMAYANSLVKGRGRANELEADEAGAEYMARLGYDPEEMLSMLAIMKDMETLQKKRARDKGAPRQTYHGIFATHPRNDARLRSVVTKAKSQKAEVTRENGAARYRQMTDGLVWGENFAAKEVPPTRYSNMQLRVRFDFPDDWAHTTTNNGLVVTGAPESQDARLTMEPKPRTPQTPEEYLYNYLEIPQLRDGKEIGPAGLKGYTGILPGADGKPDTRIAAVYYKFNAYIFVGEVEDPADFEAFDEAFLQSISTFRPISSREIEGQKPETMRYVKATSTTTFDALAQHLKLGETEKEDLRMINGYYPAGEPSPGEWIKIFSR